MPLIPQEVIDGTFYLYRTRKHALAGKKPAGSGFIVRHDGAPNSLWHGQGTQYYAVTNWHVACDEGASVIRLNKKDGGIDVIELGPEDWYFLPGRYDVAVASLNLDLAIHSASAVSTKLFFQPIPQWGREYIVGVGDDVFMIGLFVDHDGFTTNVPSARFGNISMLPNPQATIKQPTGYDGESYIIDMHSRTGFSGSPVYVYRTFADDLDPSWAGHEVEVSNVREWGGRFKGNVRLGKPLFGLLGIHWCQFPERWELKEKPKLKESHEALLVDGAYVEGMSGMTCVIPAWNIWEVMEMPSLKGPREAVQKAAGEAAMASLTPKLEVARENPKQDALEPDNPDHKEDFMSLLGAAAKGQSPKDRT